MHPDVAHDPYAFLLPLCGTAAFRLPPRPSTTDDRQCILDPMPGPTRGALTADHIQSLLRPIPDHLLSRYLCFEPSPPPPSATALPPLPTTTTIPPPPPPIFPNSISHNSYSGHLLHDTPPTPHHSNLDFSTSIQGHSDLQYDVVREQSHCTESLPLCVVNYQVSLPPTPEGEGLSVSIQDGFENDDIENMESPVGYSENLLYRVKELAIGHGNYCLEDDDAKHIISVMTMFRNLASPVGYSENLLSQIKELALWHDDAVLDDDYINYVVSIATKFRNLAFSSMVNKFDLSQPSRKKQRLNSQVKSNLVVSSNYLDPCKLANAEAANCSVIDLDDCPCTKSKSKGKDKESQASLSSGCSESMTNLS